MNIKDALDAARRGERVSRASWNDSSYCLRWVALFDLADALSAVSVRALRCMIGTIDVGPFVHVRQYVDRLSLDLQWSTDVEDAEADDWRIVADDETVVPPAPSEPEKLRPARIIG